MASNQLTALDVQEVTNTINDDTYQLQRHAINAAIADHIYLVINGEFFDLYRHTIQTWSPLLLNEVQIAIRDREEHEKQCGVLVNFSPEPPLYVFMTTCVPTLGYTGNDIFSVDDGVTKNPVAIDMNSLLLSSSSATTPAHMDSKRIDETALVVSKQIHVFNQRVYDLYVHSIVCFDMNILLAELLSIQTVVHDKVTATTTTDDDSGENAVRIIHHHASNMNYGTISLSAIQLLLWYMPILCTSGVSFEGYRWLDYLHQYMYPSDLFAVVDVMETFRHCLEDRGQLASVIIYAWLNDWIQHNVAYFRARYETMCEIECIRRRYPDMFIQLDHMLRTALKSTYPHCSTAQTNQCVNVIFGLFVRYATFDTVARNDTEILLAYQTLFLDLDMVNRSNGEKQLMMRSQQQRRHGHKVLETLNGRSK